MITYDVHVPIGTDSAKKAPSVKCHDTGVNLRVFPETVTVESKWRKVTTPYRIPEGSTAILKITKPDGNWVAIDARTVGDVWMLFELPVQAFTVAGTDEAEVSIYSAEGERLTTATFHIDVPKEIVHDGEEGSTSYADVVAEQIANAAKREAQKAVEGAVLCTPQELTEEQKDQARKNIGALSATAEDQLIALIEADMLPAVHDADGKILTDENGKIILRY